MTESTIHPVTEILPSADPGLAPETEPDADGGIDAEDVGDAEADGLTPEEHVRARAMFDSMGMDGEHVSVEETREMLAAELHANKRGQVI